MSATIEVQPRNMDLSGGDATRFAIQTFQLSHRFGKQWAVDHLDLQVPKGSVFGFLGLNGAGKSTTIRMLMGMLSPTAGWASVLGLDPVADDIAIKRRVGYVPDTPSFYEWMTVEETLAFVAHYRKREWDDTRAAHLLQVFDLPKMQRVGTLSKGQRAKVALTLALAFNPDLLLLDEPTLGLDPVARRQFIEGLLAEFMEGDRTVLISSHLIHEISGIVDHVAILKAGSLVRTQRVDELLAQIKRVRLTYADTPPEKIEMPDTIRTQMDGRELILVLDHFTETTASQLQQFGASRITIEDLSLEEAFVELAGRGEVL
ncbi:MAG: ABC transporter ATP-binding protein [Candidatus Sumerlaeaceae bacterium]